MAARPLQGQQPPSPPCVAGTGTGGGAGGEPAGAVLLGILTQELEPVAQAVTQVGQILPGAQFWGGPAGQCQAGQSSGTVPRFPAPHSPCLLSPAGLCGVGQGHCPSHRTVSCLLARHACCSSLHCGAAAGRRRGDTGHGAPSPRRLPPSLPPSCRCGRRSRRRRPPGRRGRACSPRAPWGPAA